MMTRETLQKAVAFMSKDDVEKEIQLYGFIKEDENAYKINLSNDMASQLTSLFSTGVNAFIVEKEFSIVSFKTADKTQGNYYEYDLDEKPNEIEQMTSVIGDKDIPEFDFKIHPLKNLDHLIIVFSDGKQTFSLYKSLYQVEMIAKSNTSFLAKLQMDKSKLEVFNEPIMRISNSFQMIQVNGTVIILYNDFH